MSSMILKAYDGNLPYIFVSYAHKDSDRVLPIISAMQNHGFRIWFDQGIEAGSEWPAFIVSRLKGCSKVLAFISPSFVESRNCRNEMNYALNINKEILVIHLEPTELMYGLELQLISSQAMFKYRSSTDAIFFDQLLGAKIIEECRGSGERSSTAPDQNSSEYNDEEFQKALKILSDEGKISVSMLQVRMNIGYEKASNIIKAMVSKRVLGAPDAGNVYRVRTIGELSVAKKAPQITSSATSAASATKPAPKPAPAPIYPENKDLVFENTNDMKGYKVTAIKGCKSAAVHIPSTHNGFPVTEIDLARFRSTVTSKFTLHIPAGIVKIQGLGDIATFLNGVEVDPNNGLFSSVDGVLYTKNKKSIIYLKTPDEGTFIFPKGISRIDSNSVYCSSSFPYEIKIPSGVTKICKEAIVCGPVLKTLRIPKSVTEIETIICKSAKDVTVAFEGSRKQWAAIKKANNWNSASAYGGNAITRVKCFDGDITL